MNKVVSVFEYQGMLHSFLEDGTGLVLKWDEEKGCHVWIIFTKVPV